MKDMGIDCAERVKRQFSLNKKTMIWAKAVCGWLIKRLVTNFISLVLINRKCYFISKKLTKIIVILNLVAL